MNRDFQVEYSHGEDGRTFYAKGHIPLDVFMDALRKETDASDPILQEQPEHCWMRVCRNFQDGYSILCAATPGSRGSFKATWIQDYL